MVTLAVIGQHVLGERSIFLGFESVVGGIQTNRREDLDCHRGGIAIDAIAGLIGEAVGSHEAGVGRVAEAAVGIEHHVAVGRRSGQAGK
jgi:hypothetical protein